MKINEKALARLVAPATGISVNKANIIIDVLKDVIIKQVELDNEVVLFGFGKFESFTRCARNGINPATGEKMTIPEIKVAKFRVGKTFKDALKN